MLGRSMLRRYALARSGLAAGAAMLLFATGAARGPWVLLILAATGATLAPVLLTRGRRSRTQAVICGDVLLPIFLVPVSGESASPFLLLFYLAVILTGITMGAATAIAAAATVTLAFLVTLTAGQFSLGWSLNGALARTVSLVQDPAQVVRLCTWVGLLFLVAVPSGYLGRTYRRRGERLLRVRRELTRTRLAADSIVSSLARGLVSLDAHGRVVKMNVTACSVLGMAEPWGEPRVEEVFAGDRAPFAAQLRAAAMGVETTSEITADVPSHPAGLRRISLTTVPLRHGSQVLGVVGIVRDVTGADAAEETQRRRDRLATIGAHSAGVVHELRNLLKPLTGAVELLEQDLEPAGDRGHLIKLIRDECDALESFLSELLKFSADGPLEVTAFRLDDLLETVVAKVRCQSEARSARIDVHCECDAAVEGDREALERMVFNLVLNSVQASPDGTIQIQGRYEDGAIVLRVRDNGPGVDPEIRERVFEPFFTTRRGGTGLGLAAARRTAEQHGGTIVLRSPAAGGAEFEVRLPQIGAAAQMAA